MTLTEEENVLLRRYREVKEHEEYKYLHLLEDIMEHGEDSDDRTGVGTRKIFGAQLKFSLRNSFPILTTRKVYWRAIVGELLWMIRGDTDAKILAREKIHIWDANSTREFLDKRGLDYPEGLIGPGYGWQWRRWNAPYNIQNGVLTPPETLDQLAEAVNKIRNSPNDRRILVSAWNPEQVPQMALPPCHLLYQFQVSDKKLHCQWYQRSVDSVLGLCFNISSYALLTCLIAKATNLEPGSVTFCGGDVHIYKNHFDAVRIQLSRKPYPFPTLVFPDVRSLEDVEDLQIQDIKLENYQAHPAIKAPMAV